jgi:hypothetical protein
MNRKSTGFTGRVPHKIFILSDKNDPTSGTKGDA